MKRFVKSISAFLFAVVVLATTVVPTFAQDAYTYTVRICTGSVDLRFDASKIATGTNVKVASDGSSIIISGLKYNNGVGLEAVLNTIDMNGSKYYIKGLRVAGEDTIKGYNVAVTGDMDFVVAYGVKGDQIAYTVSYVDENGNKLFEDATYYGNANEKVIVSSRYISGYLPDAYNKTFTLEKGEDVVNHVEFKYHVDTNTIYNTYYGSDSYEYGAAGVTIIEIPAAGGGQGGAGANVPDGGNPAAQNANPADNGAVIDDGNTPLAPQEMVDLDDEETPLATADEVMTNYAPLIAGIITGVAAVGLLALILVMKKNNVGPFSEKKDAE